MKRLSIHLRRYVFILIGLVCLLIGLLTVWTPLPTGIPLLAFGIVILATVSATARRMLKRARRHNGLFDRGMVAVEARASRTLSTMLRRTRPLERKLKAPRAMAAADRALKRVRREQSGGAAAKGH